MLPRNFIAAALLSTALAASPFGSAVAGNYSNAAGGWASAANCGEITKPAGVYKPVTINHSVNVYKPVTVNKDVNVYKPITINKDISIYKPVTITKNIDASKNITINKNVEINKSIVINKGGEASAEATAFAAALASASANANASVSNNVVIYGGGYNEFVTVNNRGGGEVSGIRTTAQCQMQEANVVKSIHALCVSPDGRMFPASHMTPATWLDSSTEGEIMRCIPGAHLKVVIGDVTETDQGMAGTYAAGEVIECNENEALRHYKDGMLKCAPKLPVKDCTERTNLRRYGTGDMFFTYRATVCVAPQTASAHEPVDLTGMSLEGGVGADN